MHRSLALALLIGYILILTVLSLFSFGTIESVGTDYDDKLHHFGAHTVLVILSYIYASISNYSKPIIFALSLSVAYGIIIEIIQLTVAASRTFDLLDLLANLLGALFAIFLLKTREFLKIN